MPAVQPNRNVSGQDLQERMSFKPPDETLVSLPRTRKGSDQERRKAIPLTEGCATQDA